MTNGITDVVLREGHIWGRQDVTVPVTYIDHIDDDIVYLTLNKHQIAALRAAPQIGMCGSIGSRSCSSEE